MTGTPLADAAAAFLAAGATPFTTPGHKRAASLIGDDPFLALDVPLAGGVEDLRMSANLLVQAEALAARVWGADLARFSVNGSTHPNQAMCLAAAARGPKAIVARTSHKSIFAGLVLAGLEPVWVSPDVDPATGLALSVPVASVAAALDDAPDVRSVLLVEPSYLGVMSDLPGIAELCAERGATLFVDAAWGAHLGFHPGVPTTPLSQGAMAMSISVHKTLSAFTQGAMLLARDGPTLDRAHLEASFDALFTTSPSAAILASLDRSRDLLERRGSDLLERTLELADMARAGLAAIEGVRCIGAEVLSHPSVAAWDPLKLVIDISATGADGLAVDSDLRCRGICVEGADRTILIPLLTIGDDTAAIERLLAELRLSLDAHRRSGLRVLTSTSAWRVRPEQVLTPRQAFFAPRERVSAAKAVGRVSVEVAAPYPPGIPAIAPGERVTSELLEELRAEAAAGARIAGVSDPTVATLLVACGA